MAERKVKLYPDECKGCMLCIDACPLKLLKKSEKVNERGYSYIVLEHPEKCTGCGLCFLMCPDAGLEIVEKDE